jgi:dolichyl-diphosphooligosaccharide--protein glycosyltransferase
LPSEDLIHGKQIELSDVDAYFHMIQADYVYDNWPNIDKFTMMLSWPQGLAIGQRPLNGWLIGTIARFGGMSVDFVGVYWPAILGILALIPILCIGWVLWNKWAGLIAVCAAAVIQGEFYGRLAMGVSDQHALETFLMCCFVLFYILALKKNKWWSIGAGVTLGMYYMNWAGAPLMTFVLLLFVSIQSIVNKFHNVSNKELTLITFITAFVSLFIFFPIGYTEPLYIMILVSSCLSSIIIQAISILTKKLNRYWYPVILVTFVGCCVWFLYIVAPAVTTDAFNSVYSILGTMGAWSGNLGSTISEVQPIFAPYGEFTLDLVWGCFGLVALFGFTGLIILFTRLKGKPESLFILIWCLSMIAVTIMQRRFGYYSAVNLCLLSAYVFYIILNKVGWRKHSKKEIKKQGKEKVYFSPVIAVVGAIMVLVTIVIPNAYLTTREAHNHPYLMTVAWREAMNYLKDETPKTNDYGVLSWWDYGYWIAREGQRPALCHPGGGNTNGAAQFLSAYSTAEAIPIIEESNIRYIVIDYLMVYQKFYAIPLLAGKGKITEAQYNTTQVVRMFFSESGTEGYRQVFGSSTKYNGHSQVKIYERYAPLVEPCNCGK